MQALVGREGEIEAASTFLDRLEAGPAVLLFAGEPGIGKTTLWTAAVEQARDRGFLVLSARGVEAEGELGYAALADLLEPIAEDMLPELPEPQRRALAIALLVEDPGQRRIDLRAVGAATTTILRRLSQEAAVVVAVDDLQWLDRPSARTLDFVLRRIGSSPVGLVTSLRIDHGVTAPFDVSRVLPEGRVERVEVGPLSLAALHEVLKGRLGRSFPRRTILRVEQAARGNPFYALELARSLPEDAQTGLAALPVPDNLGQLVEARISRLPKASRTALLAAAALPSPTVELITAGIDATASQARTALERAAKAGIVRLEESAVCFSHPLFAAAVYSSAQPRERREMHRRLARIVPELEERARHLALASEAADAATASVLDEAAEHARRRGAPDTAAALAEHARLLTPPDQVAHVQRRTVQTAEYQFHAGELRRAREALESVLAEVEDVGLRAEALRLLGEIRFHESSFLAAIAHFEEALSLAGNDPALQALIETQLAFGTNLAGDFASARVHADRALELAEALGVEEGLAEPLAVSVIADYLNGGGLAESKLLRALQLEDHDRQVTAEMRPSLIAGHLMLYEGRLADSVGLLSGLRERILERGEDSDLPMVSSSLAWAECWRGNLEAGAAYAEEALECAARIGSHPMRSYALAMGALPPAYAGDSELATARAEECLGLAHQVGVDIAPQWAGWALALVALSQGDAGTAEAALAPFLPMFEEHGVPEPILAFSLPDAIEALVSTGKLERAENLLAKFEESARRLARGWALMAAGRCRALLLISRGDLDEASRAAREAVALGEGLELRLEVARTLLVAGQIERRRRQKRAAREYLERSLELFEGAGARLWAEKARDELERVRLRRVAPGELTDSERRVAELAASGMTNREVAARLFMSPKTVEANLARAYRKLDIRSRAELGARLAGAASSAAQT